MLKKNPAAKRKDGEKKKNLQRGNKEVKYAGRWQANQSPGVKWDCGSDD